jgi:uncharacterized protein YabN with tetrapyrrole methylase and pyrophosphatase domain
VTGALTVVGTGIGPLTRVTPEARAAIERADEVRYLVDDPVVENWIAQLSPRARSLRSLYANGRPRADTYEAMVEELLEPARRGSWVCAAFYGHPGVFVYPSHEAVRRARAEGLSAQMLPAVSTEDCLFADLGVDPGSVGCQSYEATRFLVHRHVPDPRAGLVLWQVGALGDVAYPPRATPDALRVLVEYLGQWYPGDHEVVAYRASPLAVVEPVVQRLPLHSLPEGEVSAMATMYVPPAEQPTRDPTLAARLGLAPAARG